MCAFFSPSFGVLFSGLQGGIRNIKVVIVASFFLAQRDEGEKSA